MEELHMDTKGQIKWGYKNSLKNEEEGIAYYTKLLTANPKNVEALFRRFWIYYKQEEYYLAKADYTKIIAHNSSTKINVLFSKKMPNLPKCIHPAMDIVNIPINDTKEIKYWTKVIKVDANDSIAYTHRGLFYYHKKEYDKAIEDATKALTLKASNSAVNYFNRSRAYYAKGQFDKATADSLLAEKHDCPSNIKMRYKGVTHTRSITHTQNAKLSTLKQYKKAIDAHIEYIAEEFGITSSDAVNQYNRAMDTYYLRYSNWIVKKIKESFKRKLKLFYHHCDWKITT